MRADPIYGYNKVVDTNHTISDTRTLFLDNGSSCISILPLTCAHASCQIKTCITFHLVYSWTDTCMPAVFVLYNNGRRHSTLSRAAAQYCVDRNVLPSVGCSSAAVITVSNTTRCCTSQVKVRPNCYRLTRSIPILPSEFRRRLRRIRSR